MATINSVQAGMWNTGSTWSTSTVPTTADVVNIAHVVTYDKDDDATVLGNITINAGGVLQWTGGAGRKALRLSGILNQNGGAVICRDGTQIRIHEAGSWTIQNVSGSNLDMKGTEPNASTTLVSASNYLDSYILVSNSASFGIGDYISVYDYTNASYTDRTDEVFRIHSISGSQVFVRRMVGPVLPLTQSINTSSNAFYMAGDARCWQSGMKFLLGNETFTVNNVDAVNEIVYTVENTTGSYASGSIGYETGTEISHSIGDKVYKIATTIVASTSGTNYIDVGSAGGWAYNDEIAIGGVGYTNSENKIILGISASTGVGGSDRIYVTPNLSASHPPDSLVVKLNRDCVFIGTSDNTQRNNAGYIYIIYGNTARLLNIENVDIKYAGNDGSSYYGCYCNRSYYTGSKIVNCVSRHAYKSGYNGMMCYYSAQYGIMKNNVSYDIQYGLGSYSSMYYGYYTGNISMKSNSVGMPAYSYLGDQWEYNFLDSHNSWALYWNSVMSSFPSTIYNGRNSFKAKYWYLNYCVTPVYNPYSFNLNYMMEKFLIKNITNTRLCYNDTYAATGTILNKVITDEQWRNSANNNASSYLESDTPDLIGQVTLLSNYGYIPGNKYLIYRYGYGTIDEYVKLSSAYSWKFTPQSNAFYSTIGFFAIVQGITGKTIRANGWVRKNSAFNGTVPFIKIRNDEYVDKVTVSMDNANDTWEYLTASYTCEKDGLYLVYLGAYANAGNFWIDVPQLDTGGCISSTFVFESIWQRKSFDNNTYSVVLSGVTL